MPRWRNWQTRSLEEAVPQGVEVQVLSSAHTSSFMKLILGSQSLSRKIVLERAGYHFDVMQADIDEKVIRSDNFFELPLLLARAKAKSLLNRISEPALLITLDQVVVCNGVLREKPETKEQAKEYLESYSVFPAETITAIVVTNTTNGKQQEGVDVSKIFFNPIPSDVVVELIQEGKIFQAAGGFMVEHPIIRPYINRIEGIEGLPLLLIERLINEVRD